jgi:hypothetical protein
MKIQMELNLPRTKLLTQMHEKLPEYVPLEVQLDIHGFICILYFSIFLLYMFRVLFAPILRSTNCTVKYGLSVLKV